MTITAADAAADVMVIMIISEYHYDIPFISLVRTNI